MLFFNIFNSCFFYYNVEVLLLFIIILIILFILLKNVSFKFWLLYNVFEKYNFIDKFLHSLINFSIFSSINLIYILFCVYDKRFFFYNLNYFNNSFIVLFKFIILFIFIITLMFCINYFNFDKINKTFEFFILLWFSLIGMFLMISCCDFISLYLCIELQSISFYILSAYKQTSVFSIEAGLKYFILGTFSSGLLLFGISIIYFFTGLQNFFEIEFLFLQMPLLYFNILLIIGLLLFLISIFFKTSIAPFHMWSPDVYEGAPTIITFFLSLAPKIAFVGLLIKLSINFFNILQENLLLLFNIACVISLFLASFAVLIQIKIKRLLAYSSIANVGLFLTLLIPANLESFVISLFFFFLYIFITINIFLILLGFRYYYNFSKIKNIYEIFGFLKFNSIFSFIIMTNLFSILGLPPFMGFFSKLFLFINLFQSEYIYILIFCFVASVISGFVYLKLIRLLFFNKFNNLLFFMPLSVINIFVILFNFTLNFVFFKYSDIFFQLYFNFILDNLLINYYFF
jgi:NADH-quinone oxidoreductase subunit N